MPVSEKKLRSNPAWIKRHLTDPFVKKSVQEGYRARSVYKLMEIDDKDKIIKPGISWKGRRSTSFSPIWPRTCPVLPRPTLPAACS